MKKRNVSQSLEQRNPDRARLWHPSKNGDLTPTTVSYGSDKSVWWLCNEDQDHEWYGPINRGGGCPKCREGFQTSFPELILRFIVKSVFHDAVPNYKLEGFEPFKSVDIYIPSLHLIIEHDGYFHHKDFVERDSEKSKQLLQAGYNLIRVRQASQESLPELLPLQGIENIQINTYTFTSNENRLYQALLNVLYLIRRNYLLSDKQIKEINELDNIQFREIRMLVLEQVRPIEKANNILTRKPSLESEWNHKRNFSYKPIHFNAGTGFKVWWVCEYGHEWDAAIGSRTKEFDVGCPFCSGVYATDESCLANVQPDLAKRWDYQRNKGASPRDILPNSNKTFFWICEQCGESYSMSPNLYCSGKQAGCPYCAGKKVNDRNCVAATHPELLDEWDPCNLKTPYQVTAGSKYKASWRCKVCSNTWEAAVHSRTGPGKQGCRECNKGGWKDKPIREGESLAELFPEVAAQWHPTRNELGPHEVRPGSHELAWWLCKNGHEWPAKIYSRKKTFCKYCPRPDRRKEARSLS